MDKIIETCFRKWARVTKPNNNLSEAYMKMARKDVAALKSLPDADRMWKAVTAYYARYHMLTALLQKVGVDCKDHNCSINIAEYIFPGDKKMFSEIREAKRHRINLQYYIDRPVDDNALKKNLDSVDLFLDKLSGMLESLTRELIEDTRRRLPRVRRNGGAAK